MGRNSTVWCLLVAASVVGGCSGTDGAQSIPSTGPPESPVSTPHATTSTKTPPGTTTSGSEADSLPTCGEIGSGTTPPDCRLQSRDPVGVTFEVRRGVSGGKTTMTIDVLAEGSRVQTLTERDIQHPSDPALRDVDGDGRDELLVPMHLATANTRYAVYHADGTATEFHRAGELVGVGIDTTADGYVVTPERADYATWNIGFWRIAADTLRPIVTAQVRPRHTEDGETAASECTVVDAGGLSDTGLSSLDEARERFCAEPSVQRVMRR